MSKFKHRLVETPMGSTIDSLCEGGYLVCDRDHNCREVLKLWEADDYLREQENGFDYPYATNFRPARWLPITHRPPQWILPFRSIPGSSLRRHCVLFLSILIEAAERDLTRSISLPDVMSQMHEQRVNASKVLWHLWKAELQSESISTANETADAAIDAVTSFKASCRALIPVLMLLLRGGRKK